MGNALAGCSLHVSFDVDDTLVCGPGVPTEQCVPLWSRWRYREEAPRRGCRALMQALAQRRCRIWLYTTSGRSRHYLHGWFRHFGVPLAGVVNQTMHAAVVGHRGPSKYPPAFGIGLHVDDSPGVALEGLTHGFRVVIVAPHDESWTERVLAAVDDLLCARSMPPQEEISSAPRLARNGRDARLHAQTSPADGGTAKIESGALETR